VEKSAVGAPRLRTSRGTSSEARTAEVSPINWRYAPGLAYPPGPSSRRKTTSRTPPHVKASPRLGGTRNLPQRDKKTDDAAQKRKLRQLRAEETIITRFHIKLVKKDRAHNNAGDAKAPVPLAPLRPRPLPAGNRDRPSSRRSHNANCRGSRSFPHSAGGGRRSRQG
jgi:hypothetical protein